MTARNFSEDGASGAMTGASVGGISMTDPGPVTNSGSQPSSSPGAILDADSFGGGGWGGGGLTFSGSPSRSAGGIGADSFGDGGGWGGGGLAAPGGTRAPAQNYSGDWRDQINQNPYASWMHHTGRMQDTTGGLIQDTGGFNTSVTSFAAGGAIDEDPNATDPQGSAMGASLQQSINKAIATATGVLDFGRKLHGLGGGQQQAMNTTGFNQSDNIEDRRDNDPTNPNPTGLDRISQNVSDNSSKIVDKVKGMFAPDPTKNQMSQDAGINDVGSEGGAQASAQQAIPTDEEEPQ